MDHDQRTTIKTMIRPKNTGTPQDTITRTRPKVNSVRFDGQYDHIHHIENSINIITLLMHKKKTLKTMRSNKNNYMNTQTIT